MADSKSKHDMMTRILSWGIIVFLLVFGYALNQHAMFELGKKNEEEKLIEAKREKAAELRARAEEQKNGNRVESANLRVDAAKEELEAKELDDGVKDGVSLGLGLIMSAIFFATGYVWILAWFYKKYPAEMADYVVPRTVALIYGVFISLAVLTTAVMTAVF